MDVIFAMPALQGGWARGGASVLLQMVGGLTESNSYLAA